MVAHGGVASGADLGRDRSGCSRTASDCAHHRRGVAAGGGSGTLLFPFVPPTQKKRRLAAFGHRGTAVARASGVLRHCTIGLAFFSAAAVTVAATLLADGLTAWIAEVRDARRRARRAEARWTEAGIIAAAAQRWLQTPHAWGGAPVDSFEDVTLQLLGFASALDDSRAYRTPTGRYRLFAIPARQWNATWGLSLGNCAVPGLIVVGTGGADEESVAVLALGGVIMHRLPRVPFALSRAIAQPSPSPTAAPATLSAPLPTVTPRRQLTSRPARHRRTPRLSTQRLPERRRRERVGYPVRS